MRRWFKYWGLVIRRAWRRSWAAIVDRSLWAILRDALLLALAVCSLILLEPVLTEMKAPTNVNESIFDVVLWTAVLAFFVIVLFAICFMIETLFITPYVLWDEERTRAQESAAAAGNDAAEMVQLKRREIEAIEAQTSELRLTRQESHPWAIAAKERDLKSARLAIELAGAERLKKAIPKRAQGAVTATTSSGRRDRALERLLVRFDVAAVADNKHPPVPSTQCFEASDFLGQAEANGFRFVQSGPYENPIRDPDGRPISWTHYVDVFPSREAQSAIRYMLGIRQ